MKNLILAAGSLAAVVLALAFAPPEPGPFLEKPYLQLGDAPKLSPQESLVVLWHTADTPADWNVEVRTSKDRDWRAAGTPSAQDGTGTGNRGSTIGAGAGCVQRRGRRAPRVGGNDPGTY